MYRVWRTISRCGEGERERELDQATLSGRGEMKMGGRDFDRATLSGRGEVKMGGRDSLSAISCRNGMFV